MLDGECRECGVGLPGGGYLCDDCDTLEIVTERADGGGAYQ